MLTLKQAQQLTRIVDLDSCITEDQNLNSLLYSNFKKGLDPYNTKILCVACDASGTLTLTVYDEHYGMGVELEEGQKTLPFEEQVSVMLIKLAALVNCLSGQPK